jgi:hypothetical protein
MEMLNNIRHSTNISSEFFVESVAYHEEIGTVALVERGVAPWGSSATIRPAVLDS